MQTFGWKDPAIKRTWNPIEKTWTNSMPSFYYFITQFLFEAVKGLEDVVEIIPGKIVHVDLVFWWLMIQFSTKLLHRFYSFRYHEESVWSRRATQVRNCKASWEHAAVEAAYGFLSHTLCQTNHLLLQYSFIQIISPITLFL